MLDIEEIKNRIPHRYPFLLVDRVTQIEENKIIAYKNVTINEEFFKGHFPEHPIMPGVLIIEGMAQALGVLVFEGKKDILPYFAGIEKAKFKKPVRPGDQLYYEVELVKMRGSIVKGEGVAKVNGEIVATAKLTFAFVKK